MVCSTFIHLVSHVSQYYNSCWAMQHFAVGGYAMFKRFATLLALVPLAWLLVPASAEAG
ncbi:MAG: hypothetical protein WCB27_26875 [Thermoguttaceae bacterium]